MMNRCTCGCGQPDVLPLAMTYMPMQVWRSIYTPCDALRAGTIFEELDLPFYGKGGVCG